MTKIVLNTVKDHLLRYLYVLRDTLIHFIRWAKLDKIKYFDDYGIYLLGFEVAGGVSMILTGSLLGWIMSLFTKPIGFIGIIIFTPFGLLIIVPPIIWIFGFFREWRKVINKIL